MNTLLLRVYVNRTFPWEFQIFTNLLPSSLKLWISGNLGSILEIYIKYIQEFNFASITV